MIISGANSQVLAARLATELDEPLGSVVYDRFPDGELYVRIETATTPDRAIIVASTTSSDAHLQLLQLQDAARELDVKTVTTVIPYLGYARQDTAFTPGEAVSARAVANAIDTGTDEVITVNPHETSVSEFFDPPATVLNAASRLADPLQPGLADPVFLAPDQGATDLARSVRDGYGTGMVDAFEKTRHSGDEVEITPSEIDPAGRDVVLVDDIVATGSTMSEAVITLQNRDVNRVIVACVHAVLTGNAYTKLTRAGVDAMHATDTVEQPVSTVSVAPTIAETITE